MLSQVLPCLEQWTWLLIPAFVLYYWQNAKLELEGVGLLAALCAAAIALVASVVMFSFIVFPAAFAVCILFYVWRAVFSTNGFVKLTSLALLASFAGTAAWGVGQKQLLGRDYGLSRFQAGGPGQSFFKQMAEDPNFDAGHYLEVLCQGTSRQADNVEKIFLSHRNKIKSKAEFEKELQILESGLAKCPEPRRIQLQGILASYSADKPVWAKSELEAQPETRTEPGQRPSATPSP